VQQRRIGTATVSAVGLGEMPMSLLGRPPREQSIQTIHAALDAGITLIDTADAYCGTDADFGHGEELIAEALRGVTGAEVLVATKGGHTRDARGGWHVNGHPDYLRSACEASLRRLGVEAIGLYQFHRPDPRVPFADSIETLRELADAGKIRMAGISNTDTAQIEQARQILGDRLVSVQNQFSPAYRRSATELALCDQLGIAFLPWSPLGGMGTASNLGDRHQPFAEIAKDHGVSPQRVCLAWMLAKSPVVIPIPGSSRPATTRDSAAAVSLRLSEDELARLG
jgi:aryl-alcohol dehydrogenase-like predicted oxidoreductase